MSGPSSSIRGRTILPPPSGMDTISGIRKLVRTPASWISTAASRGKPLTSAPTSVEVPPTSTTMPSRTPDSQAAPLMLLVGPEDMVRTGKRAANSVSISVPSFWLINRGAEMPRDSRASAMPRMVRAAMSPRQALRVAAFSRSSSPIRPFSWDRHRRKSGASSRMIAAASVSWAGFTREKTPERATARAPCCRKSRTASLSS